MELSVRLDGDPKKRNKKITSQNSTTLVAKKGVINGRVKRGYADCDETN